MFIESVIVTVDNLCESARACGEKYRVALCILFIPLPCETDFGICHIRA